MSKPVAVRFDDETLAALNAYARRLGVSQSHALRFLVRVGLGQDAGAAAYREGYVAGMAAFRQALARVAQEQGAAR